MPELRPTVTGLVTSGEAINRLKQVFGSAEATEKVAAQCLSVLGDYSHLTASNRALLRSTLLWWMWYEHIVKFTATLPAKAPIKLALMNATAEVMPEMFQQDVPDGGLKKAGAVRTSGESPDGIPLYTLGGSLNPWTTISELMEMIEQPVEGNESSTVLGAVNPFFSILAAQLFKFNPQTGREFRDPSTVGKDGKFYDPKDIKHGVLEEVHRAPNLIEYVARTVFPAPTRFLERLYAKMATGGEPSAFTALPGLAGAGNPAPRTVYGPEGKPLTAASYADITKETLLGQRAFPLDPEAAERMNAMHPKKWQQVYRAMVLQGHISQGE